MLDPLVPSLSRARGMSNDFSGMTVVWPACPGLIRRDKGRGTKKRNEINACSLSPLVPLKGVAGAVQAAPPFSRLPSAQVRRENKEGQRTDKLSEGAASVRRRAGDTSKALAPEPAGRGDQ